VIFETIRSIWASLGSPFFVAHRSCSSLVLVLDPALAAATFEDEGRARGKWVISVIIVALWAIAPLPLHAHGDVHGQIVEMSQRIEKDRKNPELYLSRAELYRTHQEWDAANADYDRAFALKPLEVIDFARGRMFLEANWLLSAKITLDRFLSRQSNHVEALVTRARTLTKLEMRLEGARDYTRAINLCTEQRPELYYERAQALAGGGNTYVREAVRGLDEGIKKLGPLVTLELCAIDIEVKDKQYDTALARLDTMAAKSPRKETWLARRGDILVQAGKNEEARKAFQAALDAMETLPPARKNVPAMLELQTRLRDQLSKLK